MTTDRPAGSANDFHGMIMRFALLLYGLISLRSTLLAVEITVGTSRLSIPTPGGYSLITSEMQPYSEYAKQFVPSGSEQFALFLSDVDAASAARGEIPAFDRRFYVQTVNSLIHSFVSKGEFERIKQSLRSMNEGVVKELKRKIPDMEQRINKRLSANFDLDLGLSIDQMIPLPPHHETDRSLAYSMLFKLNFNDEEGKPAVRERVATCTIVHVQGKVLFLQSNAEKSGLDWSRAESLKWADAVIAANPSDGDIAVRESNPSRKGFDWRKVVGKGIAGAIVVVVLGGTVEAVRYVFRWMKGRKGS